MTFYCSLFFDEDEDFKKTDTRENLSYFIIVHKKIFGAHFGHFSTKLVSHGRCEVSSS